MMLPHETSAVRSNERARPYHSDAVDGLGHSDVPRSTPIGSRGRLGLASSGNSIGSNDSRAPVESSSSVQSRLRSETDDSWSDLKADMRYSSYADYLKAYYRKVLIAPYGDRDILLGRLSGDNPIIEREPPFTILDLSKDESSRLRVVPRFEDRIDSATRLVTSLQQPPANVTVQIVLWNSEASLSESTVNALGPALKINPRFWGALCRDGRPQLGPRHIRIGSLVATVVRHYKPDELDAVPIVLIACDGWDMMLEVAVLEEIGDVYPLEDSTINPIPAPRNCGPATYLRVLKMCLDKEEEQADDATKLILKPLIPLLYLSVISIRNSCEMLRSTYRNLRWDAAEADDKDDYLSALPDERHQLRALVEESEDDLSYLRRYISSQLSIETLSDISWRKAEADLIQIHQEAGRLESQVRDFMQLQVGELALQESKKSIQLSNQQIEEGKRVKVFTILALVYVPLNLATSIFGMNLKELNGSGKNIWVFLCTAIIALLTTGALWFVLEEVNNYLRWRKGNRYVKERFALGQRIGMLVWLQQHGHTGWMWESGAWWRLLINSGSRAWSPMEVKGMSACRIVSKFILHGPHTAFNPFERRNKYEWRDMNHWEPTDSVMCRRCGSV